MIKVIRESCKNLLYVALGIITRKLSGKLIGQKVNNSDPILHFASFQLRSSHSRPHPELQLPQETRHSILVSLHSTYCQIPAGELHIPWHSLRPKCVEPTSLTVISEVK